ncbi:PREDICTED: methyltransferase-like protein 9 [Diuraphis noxia]|uniref:methyltransferase-like protein 9 n=1 Tax=Diuraphis noxia TaxID=143948 RepID=UPI0007637DDD|nr:PREDICTED: methyltransferase-like protein 9 [Diuraphis noxia]
MCVFVYILLRRGSMFVFSADQIRRLLNMTFFDSGSTLIDLGAGDGATTEKYLPLVREIYTTEKSGPMIRILAEKGSVEPEQKLPITGATFEEQVCSAVHNVFEPSGLEVLCWTRLPYLCEGDLSQDYYWLHDAVFVMSAKTPPQVVENS